MSQAAPSSDSQHPECLMILGLRPPLTLEDVKQAYMAKAMKAHPDRGGDPQEFIRLQKAFDDATEFVKFKASKLEWLASKIDAYAQQQEVATETIERGGSIEMEETDWLRRSFGEDFGHVADKLVAVRLPGGRATDEGLLQLKELKNLRHLDLRGTRVGKLAADVPGWFENLEFLGLPKGAVGMFARMTMPRRVKLAVGDTAGEE
jgi:hypothetical protein